MLATSKRNMTEIKKIDSIMTKQLDSLKELIVGLSFTEICTFKLNQNHIKEIPWGTLKYPGIYLIEIKNNGEFKSFDLWIKKFKTEWEDEKYLKRFTPNLKKKRIKKHSELTEWIPIYIGKSKQIEGRIHEHIFKELNKTTFALKLNARENLINETFRLSTIRCEVYNYNSIIPVIESELRNRINPLIGKQ